MANELQHFDAPALTIYAKPLPLTVDPWADDAVALSDTDGIGYYTADVATPAYPYAIFRQAGASAADTDVCVATVDATVSSRSTLTAINVVSALNADTTEGGLMDTVTTAASEAEAAKEAAVALDPRLTDLEEAVGTPPVVTISPLLALSNQPAFARRNVEAAQGSANPYRWILVDASGAAVNLTGKAVRFVVGRQTDAGFETVTTYSTDAEPGNIAVGGASSNQVTVTPAVADMADAGEFAYWLWNTTDDVLLVTGRWIVEATAKEAASG